MQRASKQITLVLIGVVAVFPGCKNSPQGAEDSFDSSHADSRQTSSTRHGRGMFMPVPIGGMRSGAMRGGTGNEPNAAVAPGRTAGQAVDAPAPSRARNGFGSTGSSRGGGWYS